MSDQVDQRKRSRAMLFRNRFRVADEHAALIDFVRDLLESPHIGPPGNATRERAEALLAEVDR